MRLLYFFCLFVSLYSCQNQDSSNEINFETPLKQKKDQPENSTERQNTDSMLYFALKKADSLKSTHLKKGEVLTNRFNQDNNSYQYYFGHIFSNEKKHLLIQRLFPDKIIESELYSDIYILEKGEFKKLVSDTSYISYVDDTLMDVNFDGHLDYMVSSYSGTGCCPRDSKQAFLYNPENGEFTHVSFFNPEFNTQFKVFYEADYGQPGEISITKYKWKNFEKQLIESVYPTSTLRPDSFPKPYTFTKVIFPSEKTQLLNDVPAEYKNLAIYDYFISYQE